MEITSILKGAIGPILGGIATNLGKKLWNTCLNNPKSRFYYRTLGSKVKQLGSILYNLSWLLLGVIVWKLSFSRKMEKETKEKLVIFIVLAFLVALVTFFYYTWKRKKQQEEPILF